MPLWRGDAIVDRGVRCCRSGACEGGARCDCDAKLVPGPLCSARGAPCGQAPAFSLQIAR